MANVTYFVAMPFDRNDEGDLVAGEAQERQSTGGAGSATRRMAETAAGAVAFSRTGDPSTGEFEDAAVLKTFGETRRPSISGRGEAMYRFEVGAETFWIYATTVQGAIDLATAHVADGVDAQAMISLINEREATVVRRATAAEWET